MDKLDLILQELSSMKTNFDKRMNSMDEKINSMDARINNMESDIKDIKLTLENEVNQNIMRVAEGHLDLSRGLAKVTKSNSEFEVLTIKVNMLEADVRELKCKIS